MYRWIHSVWYENHGSWWLLMPLAGLFWIITSVRRALYRNGWLPSKVIDAPVIVVGNITAGGTGKTPVTIWLASALKSLGYRPGIVSRGYGGTGKGYLRVDAESDPARVGDEPVLIARRSDCPVLVGKDRASAAAMLADEGCDVIISDDGLQHYRLRRDYEICVVDGERRLGNRRLIPAGPLRETPRRLLSVDQVLINGCSGDASTSTAEQNALCFILEFGVARQVTGDAARPLASFVGQTVNAAAAIGNPQRFFTALEQAGLDVIGHPYPDHEPIDLKDFDADRPLLITEKDAVKLAAAPEHVWYVPVDLKMDETQEKPWLVQIDFRLKSQKS